LVDYFIGLKSRELKLGIKPKLSPGTIDRLLSYHWPGNVRELENVIERELILNRNGLLVFEHLDQFIKSDLEPNANGKTAEPLRLDDVISRHIRHVLRLTQGKIHGPEGTAELLDVNPSTLRNRMKKLGIHYGRKSN
jgi:DNA-binding NtrC family response regulator